MSDPSKTKVELLAELRALRAELARLTGAALDDSETLDTSESHLRALARNASDLIVEVDADGRFLYVSPNCEKHLGVKPEDAIGRSLQDAGLNHEVHPDDLERLLAGFANNVVGGAPSESGIQFRFRHPDGTWHWFESVGRAYHLPDGSMRAVVISRDITERKVAEQKLRDSEERYRVLVESSLDMVTELDDEGRILYISPSCREIVGYRSDEMIGTTPFHLVHPDDVDRVVATFLDGIEGGGRIWSGGPYRLRHRDGSWLWAEGSGVTYASADGSRRAIAVTRDVTARVRAEEERRSLEQQMQQSQKLEGLGVLAGGIAHDFNNLLTPILGDASLAQLDLPDDSPARPHLQRIQRAARRAAALTNQMLAYAGIGPLLLEPLDLSKLVEEMGQLLGSAISQRAALVTHLPTGLPPVQADASQLSQVVMNLITNASEAVAEAGSRIEIRTGALDLDEDTRPSPVLGGEIPSGHYVFVEVVDDGCGMDADTRARIFDPFFTTKFTGRGLGLAAVLGIVRGHHGALELSSEPGRGTTFRVLLPAAAGTPLLLGEEPPPDARWRGRGTVLIVDDDEGVRELSTDALERAGLSVLCAAGGEEGVARLRERPSEIDMVLLDRTMPGMSGEEAFDRMREIAPDVPIVLVSGYSEERALGHFANRGLAGFLQKPYLPSRLLETVRQVLEEGG